ncbi:hypothetical protein HBB16_00070 [Pseudonocardia sp. MCCB 268]|nr:hypothetical protein [Pseudonocardia cytotoxica]
MDSLTAVPAAVTMGLLARGGSALPGPSARGDPGRGLLRRPHALLRARRIRPACRLISIARRPLDPRFLMVSPDRTSRPSRFEESL